MADVDRRRFLVALGLAPAGMLMLTGCPGGSDDEGDEQDDEGGQDEGGEDEGGQDDD